jgi:predicted dehydrogenase
MMDKLKPLGVGIIGCGRIVGHHVAAIEASHDLELIAVCDLDFDRARAMAPRPQVATYKDFDAMMQENPSIDVVAIATPSGLHFTHAHQVIKRYGKSVVIEKPPTLKVADFDQLVNEANGVGAHVFPVFQYRFNAPVQRIRDGIENGELGAPRLVSIRQRWCRPQRYYDQAAWRGTYSLDGGALTNQGIHHLDLIQYLAGPVQEVFAMKATFGASIEAEDSIVATLKFVNGAIGSLEITTAARPDDIDSSISIVGTNGYATLGGWFTDKLLEYSPRPEDTHKFSQSNADAYGLGHHDIYAGVVRAMRNAGPEAVPTSASRPVIELLHALYVSAVEGRLVRLDEGAIFEPLGQYDPDLWEVYNS